MTTLICRAAVGLFAAAAVAALTGCGSDESSGGSDTASASTSASGPSGGSGDGEYRTRALEAGRAYAECARTHGAPNFPDPVIEDGELAFNVSKSELEALGQNCIEEARQIPYPPQQEVEPPSEEVYEMQLRYARCARENGLPDWPDPRRDGSDPFRNTEIGRVLYIANLGIGGRVPQEHIDVRNACYSIEREIADQEGREQNGG
jgi:hypothetical protein